MVDRGVQAAMTLQNSADPFGQWEAMLTPEVVRGRLIRSGLFSLGYELLESAVIGRLRDFYADFTDCELRPGGDYRKAVLALDPKGDGDALRASLAWLVDSDVISEEDRNAFWRIKAARNDVAHDLAQIVGGSKPESFDQLFGDMLRLLNQIQRWWVINFDAATDPAWDGVEIDPEEVTHGTSMIMQILVDVALGDEDLAGQHLRLFQAELKNRQPPT
ncbi:MAG: hypothetical protein Q8R60_10570 [Mycobacteriales bacterium]|nr:hypothetical protein [Mycobacteriales bacterium]